jgi:hypothetical protein
MIILSTDVKLAITNVRDYESTLISFNFDRYIYSDMSKDNSYMEQIFQGNA